MGIRIITDSAADILPEEAEQMGVTVVPLTLTWDGKEYRDAIDMDHKQFFTKLTSSDTIPTTSQVTPVVFEAKYKELTANGDDVIVITLSSKLSGTCQSAMIATDDYEGKVFVVDSLSAAVGQRLLVESALLYIEQGLSAKEIADRLNEDRMHIKLFARLDTLEYLKKGGRISAAVALAGGLLSIKPVISVENGEVVLAGKARGSKNANNMLRKFVAEAGGVDFTRPHCLVYSGLSDELLRQYIEDSRDLWEDHIDELPIKTLGAVIGTHIGPGAAGLAFFEKQ